jgi:hypothetical protein
MVAQQCCLLSRAFERLLRAYSDRLSLRGKNESTHTCIALASSSAVINDGRRMVEVIRRNESINDHQSSQSINLSAPLINILDYIAQEIRQDSITKPRRRKETTNYTDVLFTCTI